jgi:DNA segregation ATPase FtsK/SpoIIIE-like protein
MLLRWNRREGGTVLFTNFAPAPLVGMASSSEQAPLLPGSLQASLVGWLRGMLGYALMAACVAVAASLLTWSATDPSYIRTTSGPIRNALGATGANASDLAMRMFGLAAVLLLLPPTFWALELITRRQLEDARLKLTLAPVAVLLIACAVSALPAPAGWPLPYGLGGLLGDQSLRFLATLLTSAIPHHAIAAVGGLCLVGGLVLLTGSLGMSLHDLVLICRSQRSRTSLAVRAWRGLSRAFERAEPPVMERQEPTLDLPPRAMTVGNQHAFHVSPGFDYDDPYDDRGLDRAVDRTMDRPTGGQSRPRRTDPRRPARRSRRGAVREPESDQPPAGEFDQTTEERSRAMAKRFAPERNAPAGGFGFGLFRRRGTQAEASASRGARRSPSRPIWPGSVPVPADEEMPAVEHDVRPAGDVLYGRAVALVRAQRKASTAYLQQSLGIGYMRAADLIERMEREGVVGAPVHNGIRPILSPPPGSRIV